MISQKMFNESWRLSLSDETWEFVTLGELKVVLNTILDLKEKYGRLKKDEPIVHCNCSNEDEDQI